MSTIGRRIKLRRQDLGLSVDDLAAKLGKNRATVYRYESDEIENFPIQVIGPLSKALGVSPGYLMGWEELIEDPTPASVSAAKQDLLAMIDGLPDEQVEKLLQIARTVFEK